MSISYSLAPWAAGSNIYEVNTRQYTHSGRFQDFSAHLDRLNDMGVGILWFMPITPIGVKGRLGSLGSYYACSSYTQINPEYGHLEDFKQLVRRAHDLGMHVIIDWVANHTALDHEWTREHPDWFLQDKTGAFIERNGWEDVIDLNHNNAQMQAALIDAMKFWITECDIDGFRCDMAHLVPLSFWHEARKSCEEIKKLFWLGECDHAAYSEVFDATYAWRWMHGSADFKDNKMNMASFIQIVKSYDQLPKGALKSYFTSNHDENSWNGTEYEKYGNLALPMAAYTLLVEGIPIIYSGQELPNFERLLFFEKDEICWTSDTQLHYFYKHLLELRKHSAAFGPDAQLRLEQIGEKGVYLNRESKNERIISIFNFSMTDDLFFSLNDAELPGKYTSLNSGLSYTFKSKEDFILNPGEHIIYVRKQIE